MVSYSDYNKGKGEVYLVLILIVMDNGLLLMLLTDWISWLAS